MGVVERREREKNIRRKQILAAAEKVFVAKGFSGATMEDTLRRPNLARRPFTSTLKTEELYTYLNLRMLRYVSAKLEHLQKRDGLSPEQKLEALKGVFYNIYKFDPLSLINIFHFQASNGLKNLSPELLSEIQLFSAKSLRMIAKIFEEGIAQGVFIDRHPTALADVVWSTFGGIVLWEESKTKLNPRKKYLKKTLDLAFEVFLNSVKKK
jgi:AcrR family transcriptional regulator